MEPDYKGPERRDTLLVEEVRELRTATSVLGNRVEALSENFYVVNELTAKQQAIEATSAHAVVEAAKALAAVRAVEEVTVPRGELEQQEIERNRVIAIYRRQAAAKSTAIAIITFAIFAATILFGVNFAQSYKHDVYTVCKQRNISNQKVLDALSGPSTTTRTPAQQKQFELFKSAFELAKCEDLR